MLSMTVTASEYEVLEALLARIARRRLGAQGQDLRLPRLLPDRRG